MLADAVVGLSVPTLVAAVVLIAVAAALQGSIGFGFNILAVPILALLDPDLTPIPTMVMGIPLTALMFFREREHVDFSGMQWLIAGRIPGSFVGAALLAAVSRRFLDGFIAVVVLAAVVVIGSGYTLAHTRFTKYGVGLTSGVTGAASAIGGPPLALLYHRDSGPVIRSTLAFIFFFGQFVNLIALGLNGQLSVRPFQLAATLMPAMVVGYLASGRLRRSVEGAPIRLGVLGLSAFAGLALLTKTLFAG